MAIAYRRVSWKYVLTATYDARLPPPLDGHEVRTFAPATLIAGRLTVHAGYAWDGASGPTVDTAGTMEAALVHDVLYQLMRLGTLPMTMRPHADTLFRTLLKRDGVNVLRRWYFYLAVRWFAADAARRPETGS